VVNEEDPYVLFNCLAICDIDIILIDHFMPKITGGKLVRVLKEKYPRIKIIVLSMCEKLAEISHLIDEGIHSYVSKADPIECLLEAIYAVHDNKIYRNKWFTEALYLQKNASQINQEIIEFNEREKKVIQLLWQEKSNKEISNELFLGIRSIEKLRQDIKERVGVRTTIGLIKYALNKRIIDDLDEQNLRL
jgi:DNA-binding NarL/FixJ family response regulator